MGNLQLMQTYFLSSGNFSLNAIGAFAKRFLIHVWFFILKGLQQIFWFGISFNLRNWRYKKVLLSLPLMYRLQLNAPLSSTVKLWLMERFVLQFEIENVIFHDSSLFRQPQESETPNFWIVRKVYLKVLQVKQNPRRPSQLHTSKGIISLKVHFSVEFIVPGSNNKNPSYLQTSLSIIFSTCQYYSGRT